MITMLTAASDMRAGFVQQHCLPPSNGFHMDGGGMEGFHVDSAPQLPALQPAKDSPEDWLLPAASMAMSAPSDGSLQGSFDMHKQQQHQQQHLDRQHSLQRLQHEQQRRALTPPPLGAAPSQAPSRTSTPGAAQQEPPQPHPEQKQEAGHDPIADLLGCDWLLDPEAVAADARTLNSAPPLLPVKVG
jgi:hypothetical protein